MKAIVYTLLGREWIQRESKIVSSRSEINKYCDKVSRKYARSSGVLVEVYEGDRIIESNMM